MTSRIAAHATASGYDQLQYYLDADRIVISDELTLAQRAGAKLLRFMIRRSGSQWYHRQHLIAEFEAARCWLLGNGSIFHFLYGENAYRYLGVLPRVRSSNAIVCTYHTPPERFVQVVNDRAHLRRIDAAIVVSTRQYEFLASVIGPDRVHFIPHGIDTKIFHPKLPTEEGGQSDELFRCLFVGSHLRDLDTLAAVTHRLASESSIHFTVVTRVENHSQFAGLRNVTCRSRVDDAELLSLYQNSDLLVFPLLDCTANNSLLEAMACGLPVLTTDLQGVRDYVSPECAVLTRKGDSQQIVDAIFDLSGDGGSLRDMRQASRRRALELRWEVVARQVAELYQCLDC